MGKRIQELRKKAGFTQATLAQAMGIPEPTLKNWEQGRRTPRIVVAVELARVLGVGVEELIGDVEEKPKRKRGKV